MAKARRTKLWFSQAGVQGILGTGDGEGGGGEGEGEEIERAVEVFKMKGGQLWEREGGRDGTQENAIRELSITVYYEAYYYLYICKISNPVIFEVSL